jgi:hypothetical protein
MPGAPLPGGVCRQAGDCVEGGTRRYFRGGLKPAADSRAAGAAGFVQRGGGLPRPDQS